ncbi:hypothetical protein RDWZM_007862 [Blomia tropicalis]|uniref:SET domain-containing protein n=1 Tax=Blomia tropicalis TaxID=40697 RepID=A0A9Q0LZW6_BLOTA|nr:hypothetical protein RDWZM_007862 [Blomia tropicalis]
MVERQQHVSEKYHFVEHIGPYKRDWNCLMDHYDDIIHDPSAMHTFEYVYDELELLFDGSIRNGIEYRKLTQIVSMEMLIRIYGKILVNSFAIQESGDRTKDHGNSLRQIGRGVYLGPSIFDHSCSPDAMFTFDGTRLYLIALRDLYTDDVRQIYISYIDELETFTERQRQLRSAFYFDCACTRCTNQSFIDDGDENLQLRMLNEKIEDLYANTRFESRYVLLAQHKLHFISSISRLTQPNLHLLSNNLIAIDMKERTMCDNVCQLIDDANIENELIRCNTILAVRVSDFLASYRCNARQMERLVNIYRRYYGDHHPRLLNKIYHFIGLLLVKIAIIIDERRHRLIGNINNLPLNHLADTQLDACLQVLVRLYRQSRSIQTFIDESIDSCPSSLKNGDVYRSIIIGATLIDENSSQKKQIEYSNRTSSYRDLLQQNGQLVEHNRTQTDDSNGGTEDTRKQ